jgi:hypothetical protein
MEVYSQEKARGLRAISNSSADADSAPPNQSQVARTGRTISSYEIPRIQAYTDHCSPQQFEWVRHHRWSPYRSVSIDFPAPAVYLDRHPRHYNKRQIDNLVARKEHSFHLLLGKQRSRILWRSECHGAGDFEMGGAQGGDSSTTRSRPPKRSSLSCGINLRAERSTKKTLPYRWQ